MATRASSQALGHFTREGGFSASLKTRRLHWHGLVSDSGMWGGTETGLGFTETLELVQHCHLWPIFLGLPLYTYVSSILHLLFFTILNTRVKVKEKNISLIKFCTRLWEVGFLF